MTVSSRDLTLRQPRQPSPGAWEDKENKKAVRGSVAMAENLVSGTKLHNFETQLCQLHLCGLFPCVSNKHNDDGGGGGDNDDNNNNI